MKKRYFVTPYQLLCLALLLLFGTTLPSYAQTRVYYAVSDGSFTTTADQLRFVPLAGGTEQIAVASGTTNYPASPGTVAYDAANNRLFVANVVLASPYIAAVDATTGSVSSFLVPAAINGTGVANVTGMAVDHANGYLYYAVSDNAFGQYTDQLRRIPLTGGVEQIVVGSNTTNYPATPGALALDLPNNRLLVLNGVTSNTNSGVNNLYISAVDLTTFTVSVFTSPAIIPGASATTLGGIAVDNVNNYLYYSLRDNAITTFNDQLRRVSLTGGSEQTIVNVNSNNSGFPTSPGVLAYDAANNRVLVQDISINNREIAVVNPANGSIGRLLNNGAPIGSGSTSITGFAIGASIATPPTVATHSATSITTTSTVLGGNVTADGGASVTSRGVVYSTSNSSPTIGNSGVTQVGNGSGTGSFSATISGLIPGATYYVRAYASNSVGTSYGAVQSFATVTALTASPSSQTNVACNGGSTGAATVRASGGTSPYSYSWRNNTTSSTLPQTTATVTGLTAGNYTVTVIDASGATATSTFTLTEPSALGTAGSQANVSTYDGNNGTATVNVSGGTSPYSYSWRNTTTSSSLSQTTATVTGLTAGNYTVTVTDANGCTTSRAYTITQPAATVTATSLVHASASPTNATAVAFTLTFSGSVSGLSSSNFTLITSGLTGVGITSVSGSGTTYTVRVSTGSGDGTLRLQLANATGISPTVANVPFAGETYIIDKTPPAAPVVIVPANGSLLATTTPTYGGTAEAGSTVTVLVDSTPLAATTQVANSGSWQLTAPSGLADGTHTVVTRTTDAAGNTSANSNTNTFTIDTTAPTVAISSSAGSSGGATATSPIPFTVTFSEAVTGFGAGDVLVTNGTVTPSSFSGSGTTYPFAVTPTAGGELTVTVAANGAQDAAGNGNTASSTYALTYVAPVTATTWTGSVSTDWFTAGNWTAGVPTATVDALIPANVPNYPLVGAGTAEAKNLRLSSGATLTQTGGALSPRGDFTQQGTYTATGTSTVVLTGSTNQTLTLGTATRFVNLTVGPAGATLNGAAQISRVLTLTGNLTTTGPGNSLTLLSSASGDALVNNNGGVVTGPATVQRYIDPSLNPGPGYRHYAAPVGNSTVADLATSGFTPVVNPAYNASATPGATTPFPTVYGYDQSRLTLTNNYALFDKGFFSPRSLSEPLTVGQGYAVNIDATQLVAFTGTLNNGPITTTMTSNRDTYAAEGGWQLVGNPYPAPLDYSTVPDADRAGLDAAFYTYSSTSQYNGQYRAYLRGIGGNPVVPSGQGFFVRVSSGQTTGSLTLRNAHRQLAPTAPTFQRPTAETRPLVQLTLHGPSAATSDDTYVYFETGATDAFDAQYDAVKLPNSTGLNLSTSTSAQQLAIDGRGSLGTAPRTVPLAVGVPAAGPYALTAAQLLNLNATPVYLRDRHLGTLTDLRLTPSYQFTVTNAAVLLTDRFELVFSPQSVLATGPAALAQQVALYPNPARQAAFVALPASVGRQAVTAALVDGLGRQVRVMTLPAQGALAHPLDLSGLVTGVYTLRLRTSAGVVVKKLVIE